MPVAVSEHRDRVAAAVPVILGRDGTADDRPHAQHREILSGDDVKTPWHRLFAEGQIPAHVPEGSETRQALRVLLQSSENRVTEDVIHSARVVARAASVLELSRRGDQHQLLGLLDGKRAEHQLMEQREDRCICADAQSKGEDHHQAEQRSFSQAPEGVSNATHVVIRLQVRANVGVNCG